SPDSSTQVVPVISPLPLSENQAAKTESLSLDDVPRGRIAVTPVRTGPLPTSSLPAPEIRVVCPTAMPPTSFIALRGPGIPSNGIPRSRARGFIWPRTVQGAVAKTRIIPRLIARPGRKPLRPIGDSERDGRVE